jgi:hypothetical protein
MKMIRRVERLEHAMGVSDGPPEPPTEIHISYVSPDGQVVSTRVMKIDPPPKRFSQRGFYRFAGRRPR